LNGWQVVELMSFFSPKAQNKNYIKSIFRALKSLKALISSGWKLYYRFIDELLVHNMPLSRVKVLRASIPLASGLILIFVLSSSLLAARNPVSFRIQSTLNVFPGTASSSLWVFDETLLTHDVSEDGIYQQFSILNSAHLQLLAPTSLERNSQESHTEILFPQVPRTDEVDTEIPVSPSTVIPVINYVQETEEQESNSTIENTDTIPEQEVPQESEPITFNDLRRGVFGLFSKVTALYPLAQESVATPFADELNQPEPVMNVDVSNALSEFGGATSNNLSSQPVEVGENGVEGSDAQVEIPPEEIFPPGSVEVEMTPDLNEPENYSENQPEQNAQPDSGGYKVNDKNKRLLGGDGIEFGDFAIPPLNSGQFITNAQLRISFAAQVNTKVSSSFPSLDIEYSFGNKGDGKWESAGSILIDPEVSNALNGGYFLFALPTISKARDLDDLLVRAVLRGDTTALTGVYLDALWLEVNTETFNREVLAKRILPESLSFLKRPGLTTLLSDSIDFNRNESPRFALRYESQRNIAIRFIRDLFGRPLVEIEKISTIHRDRGPLDLVPQVDTTDDGLITIQFTEADTQKLRPGEYTIEMTFNEGEKTFTDTFSFQWGLLTVNPDQTTYQQGDTATISFGALSPSGNTLCDASLIGYVIDPNEFITLLEVSPSGLCNGNNIIDVPDYSALFMPTATGTHEIYVERVDVDGRVRSHTQDTFIVLDENPLSLKRTGPSRIYPPSAYPMTLTVNARDAFRGVLIERIPESFIVRTTDAKVVTRDGVQELSWNINLAPGESASVSYEFDAPDVSPFLYNVGPATLIGNDGVVVRTRLPLGGSLLVSENLFEEGVGEGVNISQTEEQIVIENEVAPESISDEVVESEVPDVTISVDEDVVVPIVDEVPTLPIPMDMPSETIEATDRSMSGESSNIEQSQEYTPALDGIFFEEHRQWQIASDAIGSMIVFWQDGTTIPAGWTCISCTSTSTFYERFPLGGPGYGTTSGTSTHIHTAAGSVDPSGTVNTENNAGSPTASAGSTHGHSYDPVIGSETLLPAYRQLRVIQHNSAGTPALIPAQAILIFDATLPSGWTRYSALDDRYPRGENTITSGGSNTHTHTITGSTGSAGGSIVESRNGGTRVTAADTTHTHVVNTSTVSANHEPPYIEVLFATSSVATTTPMSAITLWSGEPPAGWINRSAEAGQPFFNRYIKGASSYGAMGGGENHEHTDMTTTSGQAVGTVDARSGVVGSSDTHTHQISITDFSTASNTPPSVTVVYAKYIGLVPIFNQSTYRWYVNTNAQTPTDPWPLGGIDLAENQPITLLTTPMKKGDVARLRIQLSVSNSTSTDEIFKLQYGTSTATCNVISTWSDVGASTSSAPWRGYDNGSVSDGATLTSALLGSTTVLETYEESNPTAILPNEIGPNGKGEWDFLVMHNGAAPGTRYCFRLIESDSTELFAYTQYPELITNAAPNAPILSKPFDNEKVRTATGTFEFVSVDAESNDITYQIQIDDSYDFSSVVIDRNSESNGSQFENLVTPADKDPYNNAERIRFTQTSMLANDTTYYWRVRGKDPSASTEWGEWSTILSFTVDTSLNVSTWFQTTEEQFETNTLLGIDATASDLLLLASGSTTGTTTSTRIDIQAGDVGNVWGSFSWNDNEAVGDIVYRLQYLDATTNDWAFIPDTDLPGNITGFDTSPVSLLSLDIDIYRYIRLIAVFTFSGGSPTLSDWTVSWGYRIDTPTVSSPFANEKVATTGPTFRFVTNDPQNDDLVYEISWSTTPLFTSSTTRASDIHSGFVNASDGGDISPFVSGDTIHFTIQPGDGLSNGQTYWWQVRARDPLGDNSFSFWSTPRAFTVDTTIVVSTWFQTTQEQFERNILSGTVGVAGGVSVATTAREAMLVYGEGTATNPRYRQWNGTSWSTEGSASGASAAPAWVITRAGTAREEYMLATMGTNATVRAQIYRDGEWGNLQTITSNVGNSAAKGFDVAYEALSGDAIAVSCNNTTNPIYYVWDGTTWTSGGSITMTYTGNCDWVQLAADPTSDEIVLLSRNAAGTLYEALVWNGSGWGNSTTLGSIANTTSEGMAVVYEESGGQALIVTSDGNPGRFAWQAWNGTTWTTTATVALSGRLQWGELVRNVGNDQAAICYVDHNNNVGVVRWDGSAWTGQTNLDAAANTTASRPVSCAFETTIGRTNYLMVAYSDATNARYSFWNGSTWSTEASVSTIVGGPVARLRRTGDGEILGVFFDATNDRYDASEWSGSAWSTLQTLESDASVSASPYKEPFMIAPRNSSKEGVAVVSPPIVWSDGSGPYFAEFSWNDSQPGLSDIVYRLQYYDANTELWDFIPNSALSGNETGFTSGPIDLSGLSIVTYHTIRPYAVLSCDGSNNCPTVNDWTVEWAEGVSISGTAQEADRVTDVINGTVAVAVNGVLQAGKTGTISNGTWSIANVNLFAGDVVSVFVSDALDHDEAIAVARYATATNMSGLSLYEGHVSLGSADATTTPLTNADIGHYDATEDEDFFFDVSGSTLTLCADVNCGSASIIVRSGTIYEPKGRVVTHDFINLSTFRPGGSVLHVSGSWFNTGTVTPATSTVVFTATGTVESINETGAISPAFYNLSFGTTTGSATWNLLTPLTVQNDLSVVRGTLNRGTTSIALSGSLLTDTNGFWSGVGTTTFTGAVAKTWTDNNATKQNVGRVYIDGTSKTVTLGSAVHAESIIIGTDDILDVTTSNHTLTIHKDWINNNTFVPRSGTVVFAATTTNRTITPGASNFHSVTFNGSGGSWSFTQPNVTLLGTLTIATGTVTLPTGTTTIAGSFTNSGGSFAHNNGTILLNASSAQTVTQSATTFTNAFYNIRFSGSGSWQFTESHATTSNDFYITQGTVTFPGGVLSVGSNFLNTGGLFAHNSGTVRLTGSGTHIVDTNASFNNLAIAGSGSWSFVDANVTALGTLTASGGTLTLPSGTITLGGSLINTATLIPQSGTVLFNSTDSGESITLGASSLHHMTFNSVTGGWTISTHATSTGNVTLSALSSFTVASGQTLAVGGTFTNSVGGASTTWTGSTLSLEAGNYSINTKTNMGDTYGTLRLKPNTDISVWNSRADAYSIDSTSSLYSQDHDAQDGDLYIFGTYERTSGTEYWNNGYDFDGTLLSATTSRQLMFDLPPVQVHSLHKAHFQLLVHRLQQRVLQIREVGRIRCQSQTVQPLPHAMILLIWVLPDFHF
jgi:hypothetical protein